MAETKLLFRLGSLFDKEGFNKAEAAIGSVSKKVGKTVKDIGELTSQLGGLGGEAGKVGAFVGDMAGKFAQLGIVGGLAAGTISAAMKFLVEPMNEVLAKYDELLKENEEFLNKAYEEKWKGRLDAVKDSLKGVLDLSAATAREYEAIASAADKVATATAGTANAKGRTALGSMELDKVIAMMSTDDPATKRLIEATHDLAIAREKKAQAERETAAATEQAERAYEQAAMKTASTKARISDLEDELTKALAAEKNAHDFNREKEDGFIKAREEVERALEAAKLELVKVEGDEKAALERVTQAEEAEEQRRLAAQVEIAKNEQRLRELNKAAEEEAEARKKATEEERRQAQADADVKKLNDQMGGLNDQANARIAEIAKEMKVSEDAVKEILGLQKRVRGGMAADVDASQFGGGYRYHLDENGNINDFEDFQRNLRFQGRAARNQQAQARHNASVDKRMQDIQDKIDKGKYVSDSERRRLGEWNKMRDQRDGIAREEARQKALREEERRIRTQLSKDVADIKQKIADVLATK